MTTTTPHTPIKTGEAFTRIIDTLNDQFSLDLPNPRVYSPSQNKTLFETVPWRIYNGLKRLYYHKQIDLNKLLTSFEEWVCSRCAKDAVDVLACRQRGPSASPARAAIAKREREERLAYLMRLVADELYLLADGVPQGTRSREVVVPVHVGNRNAVANANANANSNKRRSRERPLESRLSASVSAEEESHSWDFQTAPNSPLRSINADGAESPENQDYDLRSHQVVRKETTDVLKSASNFVHRLTAALDRSTQNDAETAAQNGADFSFPTIANSVDTPSYLLDSRSGGLQTSFNTTATFATEEMTDSGSTYDDSVVAHMLSEEATIPFTSTVETFEAPRYSAEGDIIAELLQNGPFSLDHSLSGSIPLVYRYELERIGRAWGVPLNRMLAGDSISLQYDEFWKWIEGHGQRDGKSMPEKPTRKAWDAATGRTYRTDKHSEAVVLTGDLEWCEESEPGVLKLNLKPLRTEISCRFHRRYGSDRFLSLTLPAPSRPPSHLRLTKNPPLLRESVALWLTQNPHQCLGRTWKAFYVEEVKQKRKNKSEPRFRVEFFAIDGNDFVDRFNPSFDDSSHRTSPGDEAADSHTPMPLASLLEWHLSPQENMGQTNLKLFQRMSLGLSKTYATVVLKPKQVLYLRDDPNHCVMNDGCALMSRKLANQICDVLGITGHTPSAFHGRIAGAKGLWMVDAHQSQITTDDGIWIQISDSQLKINPHPREWKGPVDEDKLTFEVVKWSKPPHPADLNNQLLAVLDHGGHIKDYIADLARTGIQAVARDFEEVLRTNSPVLCRGLAQKIRPMSDGVTGNVMQSTRRFEQWMTDDVEAIVRLSEAGFPPRDFYPLRKRLGRCLKDVLSRHVEGQRIEVPLSTYAFCIADPYGVLQEDEVHFGLSNNWRDDHGQFEDNLLDGIDVLVGRLPAHLPSDIQRRRAVWKPELRHFKDVIVFSTTGNIPLAHILSGGDYDGDTPWICWDQNIVRNFCNSQPPSGTENYPPEYFGLTKHSVPMKEIRSMSEFLHSSFTFNLTLSNLGRCTVEHEKLSYDESIDSRNAKELSILLSHLVDGRKAGVHLSEEAWQKYRKKISPRVRELPAYKNPDREPRRNNVIDYIKFAVSHDEQNQVLTKLQKSFPQDERRHTRDPDLVQPWNEVYERAKIEQEAKDQKTKMDRHNVDKSLYAVLETITREIDNLQCRWTALLCGGGSSFSAQAGEAAEQARALRPPSSGNHAMLHVWRNSQSAWLELLASYAYWKMPSSSFALHAFGENLCQIKSRTLPSRTVSHDILACYRVDKKLIACLQRRDGAKEEETDGDDYEGHEAIEAMLYGTTGVGGYYDPDDQMSVE